MPPPAQADVRIVTAQGEYRMSDHDTREDAIRLATEAAKRNALEQVAIYLESVTSTRNFDITRDEIRTYTAGVVLVLDRRVTTVLDGDTVVIRVNLTAQIDSDEVVQAIGDLRKNDDARRELVVLKAEVDRLQQELKAAGRALAEASSAEQVRELTRQRRELLDKVQSNALVSQAWTDWVRAMPSLDDDLRAAAARVQTLVAQAGQLNPSNPHIRVVQEAIAARVPPTPPQPHVPTTPSHAAPTMPTYRIVPQPSAPPSLPLTLNRLLQDGHRGRE